MTQDSILWVIGLIVAVLTAILGFSGLFSPEIEKYLKVAAAVLGVISAYLRASPLPRSVFTKEQRAAIGVDQAKADTEATKQDIQAVADAAKERVP